MSLVQICLCCVTFSYIYTFLWFSVKLPVAQVIEASILLPFTEDVVTFSKGNESNIYQCLKRSWDHGGMLGGIIFVNQNA